MDNATPMLRQYLEIKKQYPGTILFFRLGDFYEMFNEDALIGSRELQITLTARQKDSPNPIPMCGVPYHAASGYISKLVAKGYRVAICDQTEQPTKGTKLVRREVVRIITPGTSVDEQLQDDREPLFLSSAVEVQDSVGVAFLDVSTGEFFVSEFDGPDRWSKARERIDRYSPKELVLPKDNAERWKADLGFARRESILYSDDGAKDLIGGGITITPVENEAADPEIATQLLQKQFGVKSLAGFGIEGRSAAIAAAGQCLAYASETRRAAADHILGLSFQESNEFLNLDAITIGNLEMISGRGGSKTSLLGTIDSTVTGMGSRLLRAWMMRPSVKRSEIETRLNAVDELGDSILRDKVRFLLKSVYDIERLVGKLGMPSFNARDLLAVSRSLGQTPELNSAIRDARSLLLQVLSENIHELPELRDLIARAISDEPPVNISDGGTIRDGFSSELDDLRAAEGSVKQAIALFETQERERTGIPTLKVRFNNVFGYYIEISKANLSKAPEHYERKQTLANAERFTTPQLKEWEATVLGAEDRIIRLETELFAEVVGAVRGEIRKLQSTARAIATLDALAALAETAAKRNYVRPILHDGDEIEIKNGRHPVVESFVEGSFVPNDVYLNNATDRLLVITGANMGGKSTLLRQVALIQVLAQIGSFVPATSARLPIVDRIWTRVGASDDLASGRSTFMVEMTETATILNNATPRSLVILDEIGRGTSTFDGLAIAWSVAEYLHNSPDHSAKTLFATHYHELAELAEHLPGAKNYQISAIERDGEVVFLHKLTPGQASKSYGIAVARLAGLPAEVIARANEVLKKLEKYELAVFSDESASGLKRAAGRSAAAQMPLFSGSNEPDSPLN
ncbi:MAG TPA: DNA mismatch repair protein MutS [Blastocatellia bacterium]|nr:DNA mismatch repair protein MutS [Blastocatellia bacterium]